MFSQSVNTRLLVRSVGAAFLLTGIAFLYGCSSDSKTDVEPVKRLEGGGATFVNPIMQAWSADRKNKGVIEINYQSNGSGFGITNMTKGTLHFGCSDAPMQQSELDAATKMNGEVLHIPTTMAAVAIIYNLEGFSGDLKLDGNVLSAIYLGKITRWNDPAITKLNPGAKLPESEIVPVYRAESSGTTFIFTDYLSKAAPSTFGAEIGANKLPAWPKVGLGQKGNGGIAGHVTRNPNCIGYVELSYAKESKLPTASLINRKGKAVQPTPEAVSAAAEAAMSLPQTGNYALHKLTYALTDVDADAAYPICGMSFAVLYKKQPAEILTPLRDFLKWATTEGQAFAPELHYAPLPAPLQKAIGARLDEMVAE